MSEMIDALIFKLNEKDVLPIELPRLIRDVMIIINNAREHTLESINQKLGQMGWQQDVLDAFTFELMLEFIETEGGYRVVRHSVH